MAFQVQVRADEWAGAVTGGQWVPAVDGTLNQTGTPADEASTFDTRARAQAVADFVRAESGACEVRIVEVA